MPGFKDDAQHSRSKSLRIRVAGAVAATGLALTGCAQNTEARPVETTSQLPPTPDKPSTTASETPTASETQTSAEFTPGATGKYSPEALAAIADDPEALAKVFEITGDTPEEIVKNGQAAMIGYLMAGADEKDLGKFRDSNGFVNTTNLTRYREAMLEKYGDAACLGMNGHPCTFEKEVQDRKLIILTIYALNRVNSPNTAGLAPDFMLGADTIDTIKVVQGSVAEGIFKVEYAFNSTNNYKGSAAEVIANNMAASDLKKAADLYSSAQKWSGPQKATTLYQKAGNHWNVVTDTIG